MKFMRIDEHTRGEAIRMRFMDLHVILPPPRVGALTVMMGGC